MFHRASDSHLASDLGAVPICAHISIHIYSMDQLFLAQYCLNMRGVGFGAEEQSKIPMLQFLNYSTRNTRTYDCIDNAMMFVHPDGFHSIFIAPQLFPIHPWTKDKRYCSVLRNLLTLFHDIGLELKGIYTLQAQHGMQCDSCCVGQPRSIL